MSHMDVMNGPYKQWEEKTSDEWLDESRLMKRVQFERHTN